MGEDREPTGLALPDGIKPIGEPGAVARLKAAEIGLALVADRQRAGLIEASRGGWVRGAASMKPSASATTPMSARGQMRSWGRLASDIERAFVQITLCYRVI